MLIKTTYPSPILQNPPSHSMNNALPQRMKMAPSLIFARVAEIRRKFLDHHIAHGEDLANFSPCELIMKGGENLDVLTGVNSDLWVLNVQNC